MLRKMPPRDPNLVGSSAIPNPTFLRQLRDAELRDGFVADHVRARFALLVRALREQRGWSQAELGQRLGKPQSVVSRLEDPDYGKLTLQTMFEVAAAFGLALYIDMPEWDDWFRLMSNMSSRNLQRQSFDLERLSRRAALEPLYQGTQGAQVHPSAATHINVSAAIPVQTPLPRDRQSIETPEIRYLISHHTISGPPQTRALPPDLEGIGHQPQSLGVGRPLRQGAPTSPPGENIHG
jgi:transcriptional regulator with XRE-family HTH domain